MDLTAGYHQLKFIYIHINLHLFCFKGKAYQCNVLLFGLNISVSGFVSALDNTLGGELLQQLIIYVDDILIILKTWEEHCEILRKTSAKFKEKGIAIKLSKLYFGREKLKLLSVNPETREAIKNCPERHSVRG